VATGTEDEGAMIPKGRGSHYVCPHCLRSRTDKHKCEEQRRAEREQQKMQAQKGRKR
jgi:hypothetical protein